jgi:tRNA 5-methylaminomethyl-2-thiouridine biosynthesis bifunctional protein
MAQHSNAAATASTYSVAGSVRRNLQAAGFLIERRPGFGSKREMLVARLAHSPRPPHGRASLATSPAAQSGRRETGTGRERHAILIGAGLAGCSTAHSLARRGWRITLIEQSDGIASGASGNPQGILQPRLAANQGAQSRFYLHALLFAFRQFKAMQSRRDIGWHGDGILRLAAEQRPGLQKLFDDPGRYYDERVVEAVASTAASHLAGVALNGSALWLPLAGWLRPQALCRAYLAEIPATSLQRHFGLAVTDIRRSDECWQVVANDKILATAPVLILCNGYQASHFAATRFLPLLPIRGQLSMAAASAASLALQRPVVGDKTICPAVAGCHSIGATFAAKVTDCRPLARDDQENLAGIGAMFADPTWFPGPVQQARASLRCNAGDYFPVVGAVPDYCGFISANRGLYRNAGAEARPHAAQLPGLFVNTAHGSHGLTSCPLAAELLASLVEEDYLPIAAGLLAKLSPGRFILRDLKRQRINPKQLLSDQKMR